MLSLDIFSIIFERLSQTTVSLTVDCRVAPIATKLKAKEVIFHQQYQEN